MYIFFDSEHSRAFEAPLAERRRKSRGNRTLRGKKFTHFTKIATGTYFFPTKVAPGCATALPASRGPGVAVMVRGAPVGALPTQHRRKAGRPRRHWARGHGSATGATTAALLGARPRQRRHKEAPVEAERLGVH